MNKLGLLNNLIVQNAFFNSPSTTTSATSQQSKPDFFNHYQQNDTTSMNLNNNNNSDFDTNNLINQLKLNLLNRQQQQQQQQPVDLNNNNTVSSFQQSLMGSNNKLSSQLNPVQPQHQQELVKKILEKQQQLQQIKLFNEQHQQMEQHVKQETISKEYSKEYILSQLRAQKQQQELTKLHQQQQLQQEAMKQQQQHELLLKQQQQLQVQQQLQQQELLRVLKQKEMIKLHQKQQQQLLESNLLVSSKTLLQDLALKDKPRLNDHIYAQRAPTPIGTKSPSPPLLSCSSSLSSSSSSSASSSCSSSSLSPRVEMNHLDGNVKNVPPSMMLDQFGMLGLLMMLKQSQTRTDKDRALALNPMDELLYGDAGNRLLEPCDQLPSEYSVRLVEEKERRRFENGEEDHLTHVLHMHSSADRSDDLLFYMFYNCCKSELQVRAHDTLASKGWCYDTKFKVWLKRVSMLQQQHNSVDFIANGQLYDLFDPNSWSIRRVDLADLARAAALAAERLQ